MNYNQNPGRRPVSRQEYEAYLKRKQEKKRKQRQKRVALLSVCLVLSLMILVCVVFLCVSLVRSFISGNGDETTLALSEVTTSAETEGETTPDETTAAETDVPAPGFVICLDPGHGYSDPGASSELMNGENEAIFTLDMVNRVRAILEGSGYHVVLTRENDDPPEGVTGSYLFNYEKRTNFANSNNVDLYLSIHYDSFPDDPSASGVRVYYYDAHPQHSDRFASKISIGLYRALGGSEPRLMAKDAASSYYVIRNVTAPSVLVEMGFCTNEEDAKNMTDPEWKEKAARGLADGVIDYIDSLDE